MLIGAGIAFAEDKVEKSQGTARARFAWEKADALDINRLGRTVEGTGVGTIEVDSGTAVWINYDPERTSADAIYEKLKNTRAYETAKLTTVVACFKGGSVLVTATASAHGAKGSSKRRGELAIRVDGLAGHSVEIDAKQAKPRGGKFKAGILIKAPREVDMDKAAGKIDRSGSGETYVQGLNVKKGGEDTVINVTVNVVVKDPAGKEQLHAIELPVPVTVSN